jgi:capsular polysaccharide biosynthesis protein
MSRLNENGLNDIFDLEVTKPSEEIIKKEELQDNTSEDIEAVKKVHYNLIEKSQDALDNLLDFAKASESPRAYEVVANLIKTTADVAKNLADISAKEKKIASAETINNTQNNNVFLTSTAELQKLLKGNRNEDV